MLTNDTHALLELKSVSKSFTLHLQNSAHLPAVAPLNLSVKKGECVVLQGPSGAGKSSVLKMIYGSYRCKHGAIFVDDGRQILNIATALPREILQLRRDVIGYVSQFLRVIPRVSTLEIITTASENQGVANNEALEKAKNLLRRLNIAERLWILPPATFSGGEQQRINIARGFIGNHTILLLDEPTASLDKENRAIVAELIAEKKKAGVAVLGIFHDEDARTRVADRIITLEPAYDGLAA